jgi:hypothetical protein
MLRAAALALSTLAFAGCVADSGGEGFTILSNQFVMPGTVGCTITPAATGPFLSHGMISTQSQSGYVFTPVMESEITAVTGEELKRTITLQGANIDLTVAALTVGHADGSFTKVSPLPALMGTDGKFQSVFSGSLPPNSGLSGMIFEILPVTTIAAIKQAAALGAGDTLDAEVTATIKPFGEMGGSRVDGKSFKYAVTVCSDCIVRDLGACPMNPTNVGNPCNPLQDGTVDCCESASGLVCPAH